MYVCAVCMYVCTCMNVCMYVCVLVYICMYICMYVFKCLYVCMHMCLRIHKCMHAYTCTYVHLEAFMHIHIYTFSYTKYSFTHISTLTQINKLTILWSCERSGVVDTAGLRDYPVCTLSGLHLENSSMGEGAKMSFQEGGKYMYVII